ncbi:hypothetical protein KL86PLE_90505 [uncultured Pleomorphomonas sp.]|uniref:Uncharacterized protein n=1 Tax=uncultured Pleomorphomonas sp. TaxID=442121 RepID=A0A212LQ04_9HYPH|nr:hypothetical protein KL86PLE_90505 [uncultured Pleomorphomonas sp.]
MFPIYNLPVIPAQAGTSGRVGRKAHIALPQTQKRGDPSPRPAFPKTQITARGRSAS